MEFEVRAQQPGEVLPETSQLAWTFAEFATTRAPLDPDAIEMVANRIIDCAAVSAAAFDRSTVRSARAQAAAHPAAGGARVTGLPRDKRVCPAWAAWANVTAVRELDFHDNHYGYGVSHPSESIAPLIAVAEATGRTGEDLLHGILTAYEIQTALSVTFNLGRRHIDHVAHLGPAVAAGLGSLLGLDTTTVFHAINHAAHVSVAPLQARKGAISGWKAHAPAHVAKLAIEAVDRAMRGQTSPAPIYEGRSGLIAGLFDAADMIHTVNLPDLDQPRTTILETFPKAHAAAYHAQALVDLAFRLRPRVPDTDDVTNVAIVTKDYTHKHIGSGSGDPEKMDPNASRETLDHSAMYIFTVALQDGTFHHDLSYRPERAGRPDTVRLWKTVRTVADPEWTRRFTERAPLFKDHGARITITFKDGTTVDDEIAVPDAHPRGARPFQRSDYLAKLATLTDGIVPDSEQRRFADVAARIASLGADEIGDFHLSTDHADMSACASDPPGLFERALRTPAPELRQIQETTS